MDRRKFLGAFPLAVGGVLATRSQAAIAQTQAQTEASVSVLSYGAVGDGVTDDTAAFQSAINYVHSVGGGLVYAPAGSYVVGAITLYPNVSIRGDGKWNTLIIPKVSDQVCFSLVNSENVAIQCGYSDFGIDCASLSDIQGFQFTCCMHFYLHNIAFVGLAQNFTIDRGWYADIDNCTSVGSATNKAGACTIWSSVDSDYVYQIGLRRYSIHNIGNGVRGPCVYIRRGVAIQLHQVNCNDALAGGAQTFCVFENDCQGCKVSESGNGAGYCGVQIQQGSGVAVSPSFLDLVSCDFDQSSYASIHVNSGTFIKIIGGNFTHVNSSAAGVLCDAGASSVLVSSATIEGFNGPGGSGIYVNGSTDIEVTNNHIDLCTFGLVFAGVCQNITGRGNTIKNCTNKYNGAIGQAGNWFSDNHGFNPIAVTTPAMPSSNSAVTNNTGTAVRVFIVGGNFTVVSVNGTAIGNGSINFNTELLPGESISITYTAAPGWSWIGL